MTGQQRVIASTATYIVEHSDIDCGFQLLTISCKITYIVEPKIINCGFQLVTVSPIASCIIYLNQKHPGCKKGTAKN